MKKIQVIDSYNIVVPYPSDQKEREIIFSLHEKQQEQLQQLLYECVNKYLFSSSEDREGMTVISK